MASQYNLSKRCTACPPIFTLNKPQTTYSAATKLKCCQATKLLSATYTLWDVWETSIHASVTIKRMHVKVSVAQCVFF